eukprot:scaffold59352_cov17-Prasinocladus_malaysianus.AAC.1
MACESRIALHSYSSLELISRLFLDSPTAYKQDISVIAHGPRTNWRSIASPIGQKEAAVLRRADASLGQKYVDGECSEGRMIPSRNHRGTDCQERHENSSPGARLTHTQ